MHPLAEQLAAITISTFWSADREVEWLAVEEERELWLDPKTVLIGKVDALGRTGDREPFFGEWKTISNYKGRYIEEEKIKWRTDPQALTYGVLLAEEANRFTVRWAIKPDAKGKGGGVAFEWFTYRTEELAHWRSQLMRVAQDIRYSRGLWPQGPWTTNFSNCFRYGIKYHCPFYDSCSQQAWANSIGAPRVPHSKLEEKWAKESKGDLVVLSSSRVDDFLNCPESYRKKWEGEGYSEDSEALTIGTDFHSLIATNIRSIMAAKEKAHAEPASL